MSAGSTVLRTWSVAIVMTMVSTGCQSNFFAAKSSISESSAGVSSVTRDFALDTNSSEASGYSNMINDMAKNFWNSSAAHIRPTGGGRMGYAVDSKSVDFWQMAQYANILYWDYRITKSAVAKEKLRRQWIFIQSTFTQQRLTSAADSDGIVHWSDDGAWELNYLMQTYEVLGDATALNDAKSLLPNIVNRFADPNHNGAGILYAQGTGTGHDSVSSSYEIMMADSAIAIYNATGENWFLNYASSVYDWTKKYLKHPDRHYYYCELDLARTKADGSSNDHLLKPQGDYFGVPVRGNSSSYSGGTMAMAVAAVRLYQITGDSSYLDEARSIGASLKTYFVRNGLLINERDPWTDGYWAPYFAAEVLFVSGVDDDDSLKTIFKNTSRYISSNQRTSEGFYGADWSGPESTAYPEVKFPMNWVEQSGAADSSDQATPGQIMTSSQSAAIIASGYLATASSAPRICIFTGAHYQGTSACYDGDSFTAHVFPSGFNDNVGSISIRGTVAVEICRDIHFGGDCTILRSSVDSMGDWASKASSARAVASDYARVCLFENNDYSGRSTCLDGLSASNAAMGSFNDLATSVRIEGDVFVQVCKDINFGGECHLVPATTTNIIDNFGSGWNDAISSFRTFPVNHAEVCFFSGLNYSGDSICYHPGDSAVDLPSGWNDRPMSMLVKGTASIQLFEDINFAGRQLSASSSMADLGSMRSKISSLRILPQ